MCLTSFYYWRIHFVVGKKTTFKKTNTTITLAVPKRNRYAGIPLCGGFVLPLVSSSIGNEWGFAFYKPNGVHELRRWFSWCQTLQRRMWRSPRSALCWEHAEVIALATVSLRIATITTLRLRVLFTSMMAASSLWSLTLHATTDSCDFVDPKLSAVLWTVHVCLSPSLFMRLLSFSERPPLKVKFLSDIFYVLLQITTFYFGRNERNGL